MKSSVGDRLTVLAVFVPRVEYQPVQSSLESTSRISMIHVIGPGGAGKSTTGEIVAELLGCPFHDLDRLFEKRHGNIDDFIALRGYAAYAWGNVETYQEIEASRPAVLALSSGFMTYPDDAHPRLPTIRQAIATLSSTVVLLPSLDLEECVVETLRRQRARPLAHHRTDAREAEVIRQRFPVYVALQARKITTMRPPAEIAAEIAALSGPFSLPQPDSSARAL
jgi:shikimate kinase